MQAWANEAVAQLQAGRRAEVSPRGHSMTGRIYDGDRVVLEPIAPSDLAIGDIVLARVVGRRCTHLVLHAILARDAERFLIGSHAGRVDGWIPAQHIFGRVTQVNFRHISPAPFITSS